MYDKTDAIIRKNFKIFTLLLQRTEEPSDKDIVYWLVLEALSHAGHKIEILTNHIPFFYSKLGSLPHHYDINISLDKDLNVNKLSSITENTLINARFGKKYDSDRLPEDILESMVSLNRLGHRLEPNDNGSIPDVYKGTYSSKVTVEDLDTSSHAKSAKMQCIKIISNGKDRSGIQHNKQQFATSANDVYLIRCKILCELAKDSFRLGLKGDCCGNIWATNVINGSINFCNTPDMHTECVGIITVPDGFAQNTQLWIMHWDKEDLSWLITDLSIRKIIDKNVIHEIYQYCSGSMASSLEKRKLSINFNLKDMNKKLLICSPFLPNTNSDASPYSFYFVDRNSLDIESIDLVVNNFNDIYVENAIDQELKKFGYKPRFKYTSISVIYTESEVKNDVRVVFLASNDTHAHFLYKISRNFKKFLFVIPTIECKNEKALDFLNAKGISPVEIDYRDFECHDIERFKPDIIVCGADWTSEFIAVKRIGDRMNIPTIAIQEGPQDWEQRIKGADPNKYRNAKILFTQGAVTLNYIEPKYFAVTGNPKTDHIIEHDLPPDPKVFINCNFTYGQYEEYRDSWINDVTSVCHELNLDYIISKHPRDNGILSNTHVINSSTSKIADQFKEVSIVISRFSNISYEALVYGRSSVYYNPHHEPMRTFNDDKNGGISIIYNRDDLMTLLKEHIKNKAFDRDSAINTMSHHCGPMDNNSMERITMFIKNIPRTHVSNDFKSHLIKRPIFLEDNEIVFSVVICTHNRYMELKRAVSSVTSNPEDIFKYEIIIVDNASTDDTKNIINDFKNYNNIRYIFEPKLGLSVARNTGWQNSRGNYIVFLDDDGEVDENWLLEFYRVFENRPEACAVGGKICPIFSKKKPWWINGHSNRFYGEYKLYDNVFQCNWVPGGNAAWRIEVLRSTGGFDNRFGRIGKRPTLGSEESVLIHEAIKRGWKLYYSPFAFMKHHITTDKEKYSWLLKRYYGQGKTEFRLYVNGIVNKVSPNVYDIVTKDIWHIGSAFKLFLRLLLKIIHRDKIEVNNIFLSIIQKFGWVGESIQHLLSKKMKQDDNQINKQFDILILPENNIMNQYKVDGQAFPDTNILSIIIDNNKISFSANTDDCKNNLHETPNEIKLSKHLSKRLKICMNNSKPISDGLFAIEFSLLSKKIDNSLQRLLLKD